MPLFITDVEFLEIGSQPELLAAKADDFIRALLLDNETLKASLSAAEIRTEQAASLIEQRYLAVTNENAQLEREKVELTKLLESRQLELSESKAQAAKLQIEGVKAATQGEQSQLELDELRATKLELVALLEHKNQELNEKNVSIQQYLEKIVALTNEGARLNGKLREQQAEVGRCNSQLSRVSQEKELLTEHTGWLRDELAKCTSVQHQERSAAAKEHERLAAARDEARKQSAAAAENLERVKSKQRETESELERVRQELRFSAEEATVQQEAMQAELDTAKRLAGLYKESAEDWSHKATELEGVIQAAEEHLKQVEEEAAGVLQAEKAAHQATKESARALQAKLEHELGDARAAAQQGSPADARDLLQLVRRRERPPRAPEGEGRGAGTLALLPVPAVGPEVSSTALAAALLREGWSLAHMYARYQEVEDAARHERQLRVEAERQLDMIMRAVEQKASEFQEQQAEHERVMEAYEALEGALAQAALRHRELDKELREQKADLRHSERQIKVLERTRDQLQAQTAALLAELEAMRGTAQEGSGSARLGASVPSAIDSLVARNAELQEECQKLHMELETSRQELKAEYDERVADNLREVEKVAERLRTSHLAIENMEGQIQFFKRRYEEARGALALDAKAAEGQQMERAQGGLQHECDFKRQLEHSQEELRSLKADIKSHTAALQEEHTQARKDASDARIALSRAEAVVKDLSERLSTARKDAADQARELSSYLTRTVELTSTVTQLQAQLREAGERCELAEARTRSLMADVQVAERQQEVVSAAERRASEQLAHASDRLHHLQAVLDTMGATQEAKEALRLEAQQQLEQRLQQVQLEWADARKELEHERQHSRLLTESRDKTLEETSARVQACIRDLEAARAAAAEANTQRLLAEQKVEHLQDSLSRAQQQEKAKPTEASLGEGAGKAPEQGTAPPEDSDVLASLSAAQAELKRAQEDAAAEREHVKQYKAIALANEEGLAILTAELELQRQEAVRSREAHDTQLGALQARISELEAQRSSLQTQLTAETAAKEAALEQREAEVERLRAEMDSERHKFQAASARMEVLERDMAEVRERVNVERKKYEEQVLAEAAAIREMQEQGRRLATLQEDLRAAQDRAHAAETRLRSAEAKLESEHTELTASRDAAAKRAQEAEDQNRLLLDRLEALHVVSAEAARRDSLGADAEGQRPSLRASLDMESRDVAAEGQLHDVLRYLRRSKEAAETELSLLKQERLRLQKQLDTSQRESQEFQARLRQLEGQSTSLVCSESEFQAMRSQVERLALMDGVVKALRAEADTWRQRAETSERKAVEASKELEPLRQQLREKSIELGATEPELVRARAEAESWRKRVTQLLSKYKTVDLDEYERLRDLVAQLEKKTKEYEARKVALQRETEAAQATSKDLQAKLATCEKALSDKDSHINQLKARAKELEVGLADKGRAALGFEKQLQELKRQLETENENQQGSSAKMRKIMEDYNVRGKTIADLKEELERARHEKEKAATELQNQKKLTNDRFKEQRAKIKAAMDAAMGKAYAIFDAYKSETDRQLAAVEQRLAAAEGAAKGEAAPLQAQLPTRESVTGTLAGIREDLRADVVQLTEELNGPPPVPEAMEVAEAPAAPALEPPPAAASPARPPRGGGAPAASPAALGGAAPALLVAVPASSPAGDGERPPAAAATPEAPPPAPASSTTAAPHLSVLPASTPPEGTPAEPRPSTEEGDMRLKAMREQLLAAQKSKQLAALAQAGRASLPPLPPPEPLLSAAEASKRPAPDAAADGSDPTGKRRRKLDRTALVAGAAGAGDEGDKEAGRDTVMAAAEEVPAPDAGGEAPEGGGSAEPVAGMPAAPASAAEAPPPAVPVPAEGAQAALVSAPPVAAEPGGVDAGVAATSEDAAKTEELNTVETGEEVTGGGGLPAVVEQVEAPASARALEAPPQPRGEASPALAGLPSNTGLLGRPPGGALLPTPGGGAGSGVLAAQPPAPDASGSSKGPDPGLAGGGQAPAAAPGGALPPGVTEAGRQGAGRPVAGRGRVLQGGMARGGRGMVMGHASLLQAGAAARGGRRAVRGGREGGRAFRGRGTVPGGRRGTSGGPMQPGAAQPEGSADVPVDNMFASLEEEGGS